MLPADIFETVSWDLGLERVGRINLSPERWSPTWIRTQNRWFSIFIKVAWMPEDKIGLSLLTMWSFGRGCYCVSRKFSYPLTARVTSSTRRCSWGEVGYCIDRVPIWLGGRWVIVREVTTTFQPRHKDPPKRRKWEHPIVIIRIANTIIIIIIIMITTTKVRGGQKIISNNIFPI